MGRSYSQKDLKVLWGAQARCAFPGCREKLVVEATEQDTAKPIGKICHIIAHSDDGPRGDPDFPVEDRDNPDNLILLCGTHHDCIDVHENTYTSEDIRQWKVDHERWVEDTLSDAVAALTFKELEQVTDTLLANPPLQDDPDLSPPARPIEKMQYNELTSAIAAYYTIGQLRFVDVEAFVSNASAWDPAFGDRLKAGFQEQYEELKSRGLRGDDLYISLAEWASGGTLALFDRKAAGVAILSYLFHICDVFEREPVDDSSD
jgi:hypothetical protein